MTNQDPLDQPGTALNVACGFIIKSRTRREQEKPGEGPLVEALKAIKVAGLVPGKRQQLKTDPIVSLLFDDKGGFGRDYREMLDSWGLLDVPYAGLDCFGDDLASRFGVWYPTSEELLTVLRKGTPPGGGPVKKAWSDPRKDWWIGALTWLIVGNDLKVINLYQRAGFRGPTSLRTIPDTRVVVAITRAIRWAPVDAKLSLPTPAQRAAMTADLEPGVAQAGRGRSGPGSLTREARAT